MRNKSLLTAVCVCFCLAAASAGAQTGVLVVEGGTLLDGNGGAPVRNGVVVIENGRIQAVGAKGKVSYPAGAKVLHEEGKTILPGLIDSHIHLRDWYPPVFLRYGITTVYDTANPTDWIIAQREMVKHGKIKGPRIFVTGDTIDGPPERSVPTASSEQGGYNFHAKTVQEARALVDRNAAAGVDMIKVLEGLSPELLKAVTDEASAKGLTVVGHSEDIRDATLAGLKFMEHTTPLAHAILMAENPAQLEGMEISRAESVEYRMDTKYFDPLIQLMVSKGVFINPTLSAQWRPANPRSAEWTKLTTELAHQPGIEFVPADVRQAWSRPTRSGEVNGSQEHLAEGFKKVQEFVRRYAAAGGKLTAGTDTANSTPGISLSFEMQSLVDCGATPMQAIVAVTKWAAEVGGKQKEIGTLEPGKLADITVIDGDPLQDITAIRNVAVVIKQGEIIDTSFDPNFVNPIPRTTRNGQLKGPANGPELGSISPDIAVQGGGEVTLQVIGKRFTPQSVVRFGNTDLKTQFISDSKLSAIISSDSLQKVGSFEVRVVNPGSPVSNLAYFIVNFRY